MIRFCEGYVICFNKNEITSAQLLQKVQSDSYENYVIQIKDGDECYYITYYDLLYDKEILSHLCDKKNILYDKNVFLECNKFFNENPKHCFVPTVNKAGQFVCIAYKDTEKYVEDAQLLGCFRALYKREYVNIGTVYPQIQKVDLYEVNELSFEIYRYLKKYQFPYQLYGKSWCLLEDEFEAEMKKQSDTFKPNVMSLYGDIKDTLPPAVDSVSFFLRKSVIEQYNVFYSLLNANYNEAIYKMSEQLETRGIKTILVKIPLITDLEKLTDSEKFSLQHGINMNQDFLMSSEEEYTNLKEIYGEELWELYKDRKTLDRRVLNVINGIYHYSTIKEKRKKNIYLCGPCIVLQSDLMMEDTLVYQIQRMADSFYPNEYKVSSFSVPLELFDKWEKIIGINDLYNQDIFVFIYNHLDEKGQSDYMDLTEFFNNRREKRYFSNHPIHVNQTGSCRLAEYLFDNILKEKLSSQSAECLSYAYELDADEEEKIDSYVLSYKDYIRRGHNGAIVMNCNPYTKGHDALIQEARKQVDYLYIFVVEEDLSFFPFKDRFALVKSGTACYDNVIVLPSGSAMISRKTFPTYFIKETKQEEIIDASLDVKLFGKGIAPAFFIEKRFVGEEPFDNVTKQYNEEMKVRLPAYGLKLIEIPRKAEGGIEISASAVRKYLQAGDYEKLHKLVPETTWIYLREKYGKPQFVHEKIDLSRDICIFGLGSYLHDHEEIWHRFNIKLLCDNDEKKWGSTIRGIRCVSPKELQGYKDVLVIITVLEYQNIYNQLKLSGIECIPYSEIGRMG